MRWTLLALLAPLFGCDDDAKRAAADAAPDARSPGSDAAPPADGGGVSDAAADASLQLRCTCSDRPEDCEACFRLISRCCNQGEETFGGRLSYLLATCQGDPNCSACCDECAARTCDHVVRAGDCPLQP